MGVQDFLALTIVVGAVIYVTRSLWRTLGGGSKGSSCHCSQSKPKVDSPDMPAKSMNLKRTPLIPVDQIGIPASNQSEADKIEK